MRTFRFVFFIPVIFCANNAMADACWEIKKCNDGTCQLSASSDTPSDRRYFQCGGNGGCANGAIIYAIPEYYKCTTGKWIKLGKDKLSDELSYVRECGDSYADGTNTVQVWVNNDTYDFFRENKSGTFLDKSDICKKLKTEKVEKPKETTKPIEQPVVKDVPAPVSTQNKNDITISGTVVDENGEPLPFVNIAEVGSINSGFLNGTTSDTDGKFQLSQLNPDDQVQFSFVGFETQKVSVSLLQSGANIVMKSGAVNLNEVNISPCDTEKGETFDPKTKKCIEPKSDIAKPNESPKPETPEPAPDPEELEKKLKSARDALAAAQGKENSWANRGVTAASSAMTGLGGMQLAEGIAERWADAEAEKEMRAYIETMKCNYGGGPNITLGNEEITLPGGNELLEYYTEYKTLADNLKTTKAALGLRAGIESEVLYDRAQSGLYQYSNAERQSGGETSLFRALTDTESADATAWNDQKDASTKQLYIGGGAATVGVIGGATGNYFINRDKKERDTKK